MIEEEIRKLSKRIEDNERRINELESIIQPRMKKEKTSGIIEINDVVEDFKSLDISEYSYIYELTGLILYLAILHIAKKELSVDGLTPPEITKICKDKIRISTGVNRTTISNTLSGAGANVDRVDKPKGRGFIYRIMRTGEQLLLKTIREIQDPQ